MYFPYLRGKQFELLALRELAILPLNPQKIIPIIEPVRDGLKSITTVLKELNKIEVQVQLIINPQVGELKGKSNDIIEFINEQRRQGINNIIPSFLLHSESDSTFFTRVSTEQKYNESGYSLIHMVPVRGIEQLTSYINDSNCLYNTIHGNHIIALRRRFDKTAILGDYFTKQRINADYANEADETFSTDCFFYEREGFTAFSDFQGIGLDWIEGGMLPKAVVIHLSYRDPEQEEIRVHHFVSDTNMGIEDTAGKFYQALSKLIDFADEQGLTSMAIDSFRDLHNRQAFPGLGTIKKLSIMHHIELLHGII